MRPPVMRPGWGSRLSAQSATDVLPDPLSPVRASVPPSRNDKETWLTALTVPSGVKNSAERSSMRRMGAIKRDPFSTRARRFERLFRLYQPTPKGYGTDSETVRGYRGKYG